MSPSINLLFGVHNHQPVGNFTSVFKKATQACYRPFIESLYNYPEIKATLHFSGSLIDWLLKNHPGVLQKVKQMIVRRQVEILTGAYYEPILPIIPNRDILGQIDLLNKFIKGYFEYEPCGMWIGERVWEPKLLQILPRAGIKYILLDDFHFRLAGIKQEDLLSYYSAQEDDQNLAIFPISKSLRYLIPFSQPSQVIDYLQSLADNQGNNVATIVDDGEKFGLWPGTHKLVYQQKWLEKFFQLLIKNKNWLKAQTISEYMQKYRPKGSSFFPPASYEEMMVWSGGNFRNFFSKYPEVNSLHKRMLYVSEKLKQEDANSQAKKYLYRAQCNCPYWHGVFGGIYLRHLRGAAYRNLITAESYGEKREQPCRIEAFDFDQDGQEEIVLRNHKVNVFVIPQRGGGIFELDYIPQHTNLMDTMSRRPEAYHQNIKKDVQKRFNLRKKPIKSIHDLLQGKEKGLQNFLVYDSYRRLSLLDHFFPIGTTFKDFKDGRFKELGDFINAPYSVQHRKVSPGMSVTLQREAKIKYSAKEIPLRISKELSLNNQDARVFINYTLENLTPGTLDLIFAVEFNISPESQDLPNSLHCEGKSKDEIYSLKEDVESNAITNICLQDKVGSTEIGFTFAQETCLWSCPLETISSSESGFERNYQQTVILPYWPIKLEKTWTAKITLNLVAI